MQKTRSLRNELAGRKYKVPNRFYYWIYHFLMNGFIAKKYRPHVVVKDSLKDCKGPCFLVWNHLSRLDHAFVLQAAYPRPINIVAGYSEFFRGHLHKVFKMMNIIPKKVYTNDLIGLRGMNSIIRQGGCVAFSPEGMSSIYGTNQPIVPGTARFIRHFRIPVYFVKLKGSYLTSTKVCLDERYGRVEAELSLLFTPEDLERMSDDEVTDRLNEAFHFDDYDWAKEQKRKWKHKTGMCTRLSDICYRCPKCGSEVEMINTPDEVRCSKCGNGFTVNDFYEMIPLDDSCIIPESPSKWVAMEREHVIREIRSNRNYSYTAKGILGDIPDDRYLKNYATSEPCGEGEFTVDHEGVHYRGTRHGEEWSVDLPYSVVYALPIMTSTAKFAFYVEGEFYEFTPEIPCVGKMLLLTEEMHRLHVNDWKNFSWNDYMYAPDTSETANAAAPTRQ
ncbi:MAG: 1-acyl-sn-glycerol-3-phosphate acyltransferase [Clostridia bacterium]|nr:1-acyl-sn-glycerol-3-phosphate acyltransferase [Clostridia bacterium]